MVSYYLSVVVILTRISFSGLITAFEHYSSTPPLRVFIWIVAVGLIINAILCVCVLLKVRGVISVKRRQIFDFNSSPSRFMTFIEKMIM